MMNTEDSGNVDKIYNVFTMQEIRDMFPNVDMDAVFADSGLQPADEIIVADVGLTEGVCRHYFTDENVDALKAWAKAYGCFSGWGGAFNQEFIDASNTFNQEFMGASGSYYAGGTCGAHSCKTPCLTISASFMRNGIFPSRQSRMWKRWCDDIIEVYQDANSKP